MKPAGRLSRRLTILPSGMVERIVAPYTIPGKLRSSIYFAAPVTLVSPSLRRTFTPTAPATLRTVRTSGTLVLAAGHRRNDFDHVTISNLTRFNGVQQDLVIDGDVVKRIVQLLVDSRLQALERLQQLADG